MARKIVGIGVRASCFVLFLRCFFTISTRMCRCVPMTFPDLLRRAFFHFSLEPLRVLAFAFLVTHLLPPLS